MKENASSTAPVKRIRMPKDDFSRSVVGFIAAMIVGSLLPRTMGYLIRRVLVRSFREVFILAVAGLLTDRLARFLAGSGPAGEDA